MRQLGNLKFFVIFSILFLINDTSGLRCWRCSSDASSSTFCGKTLELRELNDQQKRWSYVECSEKPPQNIENIENLIPKCKILLQHVNDVPTYTRSCYWEQENAPSDSCAVQKYNPSYVKAVTCNTCVTDGCNDKFPEPADITKNSADSSSKDSAESLQKNSAVMAVLSHTVFAILALSILIGY